MKKSSPTWPTKSGKKIGSAILPVADGEDAIRRNSVTKDALVTQPLEQIETAYDVLEFAAVTHTKKNAIGWRDIVGTIEEVKKLPDGTEKPWKYFKLGPYQYYNYIEVKKYAEEIGAALVELGVNRGDVFNVYSQTSVNWQLMSHALGSVAVTVATAYDTLGESGLTHSLNEPECVGVFTNAELLKTLSRVLPNTPSIKLIIYDGEAPAAIVEELKTKLEGVKVLSFDDVRKLGHEKPFPKDRKPKGDDVACIMYTSGTTGTPKGVVIKHSNLVASVGAVYELLGHHFRSDDTFLAYLPLAHILEYIVELSLMFVGMTIGYGRVKTLTDASVRECNGDLVEFRPSIMVGVPAVWEMIRKGIIGKVNSSGGVRKSIFGSAVAVKKAGVPVLSGLADVVLGAVKKATGGRLRLALSGGAALSRDTQEFLNAALVTLVQGYGMTESCGMCAILPPEFLRYDSVGVPVPSVEIKLVSLPEYKYDSKGTPPRGEVWLRGPSVIQEYYKNEKLNNDKEVFPGDGWLRTGDVGQWNEDGTLSLIDRTKNLIKLHNGEYIALEQLESSYKSCNLVSNICVYATSEAKFPIAIIIPNEPHLQHALKEAGSPHASKNPHEMCSEKEVSDFVLKACNATGKKSGFSGTQLLQAVILTPDEWTPESGLVTAAQKVQRKKVAEAFDKEIKEAYKNG